MQNNSITYHDIYAGKTIVRFPPQMIRGVLVEPDPEIQYISDYWYEQMMVSIECTNKLSLDKPTFIWHIPTEKLGFDNTTAAAADYCLRVFATYIDALNAELYNRSRPDNENGKYYLYRPKGEVLIRNAAYFAHCPQKDYENGNGNTIYMLDGSIPMPPQMCLCIRMQVQLPKNKLRKAIQMLCHDLPEAVDMFISRFNIKKLEAAISLAERQTAIRAWMKNSDYCAFIANGSILPRSKGTDLPMQNAVPFISPPEDEIEVCGIRGMGIKRGVTVLTGGGYSGKSTLLNALSAGIYDHIAGDGREFCIADDSAMTVSAEDGRSVKSLNISPFIKWLPSGDTRDFSTDHTSGSTSQAANIMEAVDCGSEKLEVLDTGFIVIGDERINVCGLHNIITKQQLNALGFMLRYLETHNTDRIIDLRKRIDELYAEIGKEGLDCVFSSYFTTMERFLDMPRKCELLAVINRMRNSHIQSETGDMQC